MTHFLLSSVMLMVIDLMNKDPTSTVSYPIFIAQVYYLQRPQDFIIQSAETFRVIET